MADLELLADEFRKEGYSDQNAEARVCQDIVLKAIAESDLSRNVTIKGGVVMRSITGNIRRATQDMDLDFIRYSLNEDAIRQFIDKLNCLEGISIKITGKIEELSQQEYRGKRVYVILEDDTGHSFKSKIDLLDDEGASLLINSKEQIFAEKLRSLLRFGPLSTRYKDIFDLCYLIEYVDRERLQNCLKTYILDDEKMRENDMDAIRRRISRTFGNRTYRSNVEGSEKANWLRIKTAVAFDRIDSFLKTL